MAAAGIWSPLIGRMADVYLPLLPMKQQYVPNRREHDKLVYYRQEGTGLVLGGV